MKNTEQKAMEKPWLTPIEQIAHLKGKGVRFELMSESEAECYLTKNNNYFRLCSYRTNFAKVPMGVRAGEYERLDFGMLVDLSVIDMLLRRELLPMTLDIEHFSKLRLLREIEEGHEDGYGIVRDFICSNDSYASDGKKTNTVLDEIRKGASSAYISGLLAKYPENDYPVWAFMEIISFGTFIYFCKFCSERFCSDELQKRFYLLQSVKAMRNACAHNNCVLNNMATGKSMHRAQLEVTRALAALKISPSQRKSKMQNSVFQQIATTFYMHQALVSEGVRSHRAQSLFIFKGRMEKHRNYYGGIDVVTSGFDFISKLIDGWYPWSNDV